MGNVSRFGRSSLLHVENIIDGRKSTMTQKAFDKQTDLLHRGKIYPKQGWRVYTPAEELSADAQAVVTATTNANTEPPVEEAVKEEPTPPVENSKPDPNAVQPKAKAPARKRTTTKRKTTSTRKR